MMTLDHRHMTLHLYSDQLASDIGVRNDTLDTHSVDPWPVLTAYNLAGM